MGNALGPSANLIGGEARNIHIPRATYRLQLRSGLTLSAARGLVDYFEELGISDLYLSPILKAETEAAHGYAVADFGAIDPRIGSLESLTELAETLRPRGMGLLLDFVPNHMSASPGDNPWWRDVLEMGPRSRFANFFDIEWNGSDPDLEGRVLAPVLTEPYAAALRRGLPLERTMEGLQVVAGGSRYPLSPSTWSRALDTVRKDDGELRGLLGALEVFLEALAPGPMSARQWTEKERLKGAVLAHLELAPGLGERSDRELAQISGDEDRLRALLDGQAFRLSPWWEAASRINYRIFFDINELAALRAEDPEVFAATHGFVLGLARQGWVQGLRIDHIDGLLDPMAYLDALPPDLYVVVEKVLERHERLHRSWKCEGTTGYEALNQIERLFVSPEGEERLFGFYREVTSEEATFEDVAYEAKSELLATTFQGGLRALAERLLPFVRRLPGRGGSSLEDVVWGLGEIVACFAVYRTYLRPSETVMGDGDRRVLESAASAAGRRNAASPDTPGNGDTLFDAIASVLAGTEPGELSETDVEERRKIALRFQQFTSAVMAKGVEDTAYYRHYPLLSLNEVGGGPADITAAVAEFHERNRERAELWPRGLVASSTHDTKRDEDVRARIDVLSEIPDDWRSAVVRWMEWNRRHKRSLPSGEVPDASEEYLLYQTLIGSWPLEPLDAASHRDYVDRLLGFFEKALREAKRHTSWTESDEAYESSVSKFVERVLDPEESFRFLDDFARFERVTRRAGLLNALSRTLLKATMPGVPDFYQGSELWILGLVDPDNRRPVDFEGHRGLLRHVVEEVARDGAGRFLDAALDSLEDGRLKLYLTRSLLQARRRSQELFAEGSYEALSAAGPRADHVVAFAREREGRRALSLAGRFFTKLPSPPVGDTGWRDTHLELDGEEERPRTYREILSGRVLQTREGRLPLGEVFQHLPLALLESGTES